MRAAMWVESGGGGGQVYQEVRGMASFLSASFLSPSYSGQHTVGVTVSQLGEGNMPSNS